MFASWLCSPLNTTVISEVTRALATDLRTKNEQTEDAREGPRAFAEGRAPRWQGR